MHLILLNGPCAVGKSTVAGLLHTALHGSYLLNIDDLRRSISGYREHAKESAVLGNRLAQAVTRSCLEAGTDVIIDKQLTEATYIDAFRAIGTACNAQVHEFLLWAPKDVVMARAHARGWREGGLLTPEKCARFWDELDALKERRPDAVVLDTSRMDAHATLSIILARLTGTSA